MVLSGLVAGVLGSVAALAAWDDCDGPEFSPVAIVDAVAIYSSRHDNPGHRRRSYLEWAQADANPPAYEQYTQFRVVEYISGEGPQVINVAHSLYFSWCPIGVQFQRGERYLLGLTRSGDTFWVDGGTSASGELREALLRDGIQWTAEGFVEEFGDMSVYAEMQSLPASPPVVEPVPGVAPPPILLRQAEVRVGYSVLDDYVGERPQVER